MTILPYRQPSQPCDWIRVFRIRCEKRLNMIRELMLQSVIEMPAQTLFQKHWSDLFAIFGEMRTAASRCPRDRTQYANVCSRQLSRRDHRCFQFERGRLHNSDGSWQRGKPRG